MLDKFKDECGVFGIFGHPEAANMTYLGLYALQHRGQEAAGIVAFDGTVTAPFNMVTTVFGDNALWVVESQRGRVVRVDPAGKGEPAEVYRTGATYGGTTARDPRAAMSTSSAYTGVKASDRRSVRCPTTSCHSAMKACAPR